MSRLDALRMYWTVFEKSRCLTFSWGIKVQVTLCEQMILSHSLGWLDVKTRPPFAPVMSWGPSIDGSPLGLLDRPITLIEKGDFAQVPLLMGNNQNEG